MMKKTVQSAKEEKPTNEPSPVVPETVAQEQTQSPDAANAVPTVKSILSKVDPKKLEIAEEMGIPFRDLLSWAQSVENTQKIIIESLKSLPSEDGIANKLTEKLMAAAQKQREDMMKEAQGGGGPTKKSGGGLGDLYQFAKEAGIVGGGGSSDSSFFAELGKTWMTRKMASEDFGEFMSREMFKKILPDAIANWEKQVTDRAAAKAAGK